jgi:hypothetical protein
MKHLFVGGAWDVKVVRKKLKRNQPLTNKQQH